MNDFRPKQRILILGGGFAGVAAARRLERLFHRSADVEIVLASQDNFVVMTPLLFEVFSGTLDMRSCSLPVRAFLRSTRFVEATVDSIDLVGRKVRLKSPGQSVELAYDQLVIALGGKTNRDMIPGAAHAFTFKTLADALLLRNHVIERFETRRRGIRSAAEIGTPHIRNHRRRSGRRGAARRVNHVCGWYYALLPARRPRRRTLCFAARCRPHSAGN